MTPLTIAVLITCHNRREKTLECLRRLDRQELPVGVRLRIHLVDDGSTDGTGESVAEAFPDVRVIKGSGSLYWAGGMRVAWTDALREPADYYLLLNDDTVIEPDALASLLQLTGSPESRVIGVAAIVDPESGQVIYGAYRNGITGNLPDGAPRDWCSTFNANCVLVPKAVYDEMGILDDAYTHGLADHDYGYKAARAGIDIRQSANPLGHCSANSPVGTWKDNTLPLMNRWKLSQRPNGLPWREWLIYCRRHLGWKWPRYFMGPYLRILIKR